MKKISLGNKDALVRALEELNNESTVKIQVTHDWFEKEAPLNFKANWFSGQARDLEELERVKFELETATEMISLLNNLDLVVIGDWQELETNKEIEEKAKEWIEILKKNR